MEFDLQHAMDILSRTPAVLDKLLRGLPEEWLVSNEGENTFSPLDVVGHLCHGEEADWIARTNNIRDHGDVRVFHPFDRFAQATKYKGMSMDELLDLFASLRGKNLQTLREMDLQQSDFHLKGKHPDLGAVTLGQLLSTWVVHDLGHIGQIVRVMSKQYSNEVGPWQAYLRILKS
jgi:hypothetical protein